MRIIIDNVPQLSEENAIIVLRRIGNVCYMLGLGIVQVSVEEES